MMDYLYDGSFEGLLTCIFLNYYEEKAAAIYPGDNYQSNVLRPYRQVNTDMQQAERVYQAIRNKISEAALKRVYYLFLSNEAEKENMTLAYLRLGFRKGSYVDRLYSHPAVFDVHRTARKVSLETHRLTGLIRFSVLGSEECEKGSQLLYARIEPDHDVLELLGDHFSDRFKGEPFLIHDAKRSKALYSTGGRWFIASLDEKALPDPSRQEKEYRQMWKNYFEAIAIKERINPACQKRMMPVRYWKNLTEMNGSGISRLPEGGK